MWKECAEKDTETPSTNHPVPVARFADLPLGLGTTLPEPVLDLLERDRRLRKLYMAIADAQMEFAVAVRRKFPKSVWTNRAE